MNKSIVSKLFLGAFLILFLGNVFAAISAIDVTAPNGGEHWSSDQNITWTSTGCTGDENVEIWWTKGSPTSSSEQIVDDLNCALQIYSWDTSLMTDGSDYQVYVKAKATPFNTGYSGYFTLDNTGPTAPATPVYTEGPYVNAAEATAGIIVNVDFTGTGAAVGDSLILFVADENLVFRNLSRDLNSDDISAGNYDFTVSGAVLGADEDKNITARIDDLADNTGAESTGLIITVDRVAPVVDAGENVSTNAIYTQDATVTDINGSGIDATLWEDVTEGGGAGTITFDTNIEVDTDINASADDMYLLQLTATDTAGNSASDTFLLTWDTNDPSGYTVSIDQTYINDDNKTAFSFTFAGAEVGSTYNYTINDTNVDNAAEITGTGTIATATDKISGINVTTLSDGVLTLSVTLTDVATNVGSAVTDIITKDVVAPTATNRPTTMVGSYINLVEHDAGITVTVPFGTSGAVADDVISLHILHDDASSRQPNGVIDQNDIDNGYYVFDVTGSDLNIEGAKVITAIIIDVAGNDGTYSAALNVTLDTVAPTVLLTATQTDPTNDSPLHMTATFSEAVTDFELADIDVNNGAADGFVAVSGLIYTFDVTPLGQGIVTVDINANLAIDVADNNNTAAPQFSITYDTEAPTGYSVSIDQTYINNANKAAISFTFVGAQVGTTYNYSIDDSEVGAPVTGTGTIDSVTDQISVSSLAGLIDGTVTLSVTLTDPATNVGTAATDTVTKDVVAPIISGLVLSPNGLLGIAHVVTLTITADDNTYTESDITINTEDVNGFTNLGDNTYTVIYTIAEDDTTRTSGNVPASVVLSDVAGNTNVADTRVTENTVAIDATRPTLAMTLSDNYLAGTDTATVTFTFSEEVDDFSAYDITASNGVISGLTTEDNTVFSAILTPNANVEKITNAVSVGTDWIDVAGNAPDVVYTSPNYEIHTDVTAPIISDMDAPYITWNVAYITAGIDDDSNDLLEVWLQYKEVNDENGDESDWMSVNEPVYFPANVNISLDLEDLDADTNYNVTLKVKDAAGNIASETYNFRTIEFAPYFILPKSEKGFTSTRFGDLISSNELEVMTIWDVNLTMEEFLDSNTEDYDLIVDTQPLTNDLVNNVYVYNSDDGNWTTIAHSDFNSWNVYDNITSLHYIVFDLDYDAWGTSLVHFTELP